MDAINKKTKDPFDPIFMVEGIQINSLTFVDDIVEFSKNFAEVACSTIANEVFQNENRLKFKTSKCKIIVMNRKEDNQVMLNGVAIDQVEEHRYLGTIVAGDGRETEV